MADDAGTAVPPALAGRFPGELARRLIALRRDLHRRPELSLAEEETAARLYDELAALKPAELSRVAGTGVVARIAGRDQGAPAVALRGDIDALPIQEETGLPWASERPGVMHACGHDVHAAWAVGAAALLAEDPPPGDVVVVLQPAEEVARGAQAILETGALDGVAAIFGGHVDLRVTVGRVVAQEGPLAASSDSFEIDVVGRGAHGARPHESADPVVGAAAIISALQTVVSRRLEPGHPGVVTVGQVQAGSAPNVIPQRAHLAGTLRATSEVDRRLLQEETERIATATASAYGLEASFRLLDGTPAVVNGARAAEWARRAVVAELGPEALVPLGQVNMAGEDFAFYLQRMEGCFLRVGAREHGGEVVAAHSPRFYAADGAIFVGAAVLAAVARQACRGLA